MDSIEPNETKPDEALSTLADFRHTIASDLGEIAGSTFERADRSAAKEALQLTWSFVVSDFVVTDDEESLLRAVFPDEMFQPDSESKFIELRENVDDNYAAVWKRNAGEHLCELVMAAVTIADLEPIDRYRMAALKAASAVCTLTRPVSAPAVLDLALFDSMLRRTRILTEVAIAETAVPTVDQIKSFTAKSPPEHSKSFAFLSLLPDDVAQEMLDTFADHYGAQITVELLEQPLAEPLGDEVHARLSELLARLLKRPDVAPGD